MRRSVATKITWPCRWAADQFIGLSGSSGPSHCKPLAAAPSAGVVTAFSTSSSAFAELPEEGALCVAPSVAVMDDLSLSL